MKKIFVQTIGCKKNILDGELYLNFFRQNGWDIEKDYTKADVILLNSCGYALWMHSVCIQQIREFKKNKKKKSVIIIGGCLPAISPTIVETLEVDYVFTPKTKNKLNDIINAHTSIESLSDLGASHKFNRMIINKSFFGKLFILSNGDVHSNINTKRFGNILTDSLSDLVYKEMMDVHNWKAIRSKIKPCKYCIYENLCPPISNYEYVLGRYNLCNIEAVNINEK